MPKNKIKTPVRRHGDWFFLLLLAICMLPVHCQALEPHEILVLANKNAARSVGLARYYMKKRAVPEGHLLQLWVTDKERCSREDYEKRVVVPVRRYLKEKDPEGHIRCLLTMYGLPLKVAVPKMTSKEKEELKGLKKKQDILKEQLIYLRDKEGRQSKGIKKELEDIRRRISSLEKGNQGASLDSEIALVLRKDYSLDGWMPNPFFAGYRGKEVESMRDEVLMVSRLDGPSDKIVRRIIDDSITTEKTSLRGTAYFDARYPRPKEERNKKDKIGYGFYDRSIYLAAESEKEWADACGCK